MNRENFIEGLGVESSNMNKNWITNVLIESIDSNLSDGNPRGHLKVLDNTDNVQKSNEDNGKINRLQKELEQEKAYCKFWKELTLNLKSSFEGLINKIEEGDINIDKSN